VKLLSGEKGKAHGVPFSGRKAGPVMVALTHWIPKERSSVAELEKQYLRHCKQTLKPRTVQRYETALKDVLPKLAANKANQITIEAVMAYRQERLGDGISPRTINHDVMVLGAMLRWG
jgi:hypothetical protein